MLPAATLNATDGPLRVDGPTRTRTCRNPGDGPPEIERTSAGVSMQYSRSRDIADLSPADFGVLKEGKMHYFAFVQPDGERALVKVKIERQGKRKLRQILVDYFGSAYDLTESASDRCRAEYTSYYLSKIERKLFKDLSLPGGKTHLCMSLLTEDVGGWLYKASRMILAAENLTHCAPEFQAVIAEHSARRRALSSQ